MSIQILQGDCRETLKTLPAGSAQCCVTSPPYYGLRDYGCDGQIGLEQTPSDYVAQLVDVFREVRRVLAGDGTLWLNLGDSYAGSWGAQSRGNTAGEASSRLQGSSMLEARQIGAYKLGGTNTGSLKNTPGLKSKDLIGIPWRVAFALQEDGWYLRQDIIWHKPNPMPESVQDRCTKAHEYLFLLSKSQRYYFDSQAISEPSGSWNGSKFDTGKTFEHQGRRSQRRSSGNLERKPGSARGCPEGSNSNVCGSVPWEGETRNKRSVWTVPTAPYNGAHFATFPPALITPCILAGSRPADVVLDPFGGSGTTGKVAIENGRKAILCELNPEYVKLIQQRTATTIGLPL